MEHQSFSTFARGVALTELVAPHRETAQAPLCRFGRGLRVRSQALSVCGKIACPEETRDTDDVYRFGPLGSVIPYSCVFGGSVYGQVTKYEPAPNRSGTGSGKIDPLSKWARSSFYISRGYHMPLSLSKLDCSSLHKWTEIGTVPVRVPF